jgi:hypothetical protein
MLSILEEFHDVLGLSISEAKQLTDREYTAGFIQFYK